jgi:hypothetical protein
VGLDSCIEPRVEVTTDTVPYIDTGHTTSSFMHLSPSTTGFKD